jgi:hypothetical protein
MPRYALGTTLYAVELEKGRPVLSSFTVSGISPAGWFIVERTSPSSREYGRHLFHPDDDDYGPDPGVMLRRYIRNTMGYARAMIRLDDMVSGGPALYRAEVARRLLKGLKRADVAC